MCSTNGSNGLFLFLCSGRIFDFLLTSHTHSLYHIYHRGEQLEENFFPYPAQLFTPKARRPLSPPPALVFRRTRQEKVQNFLDEITFPTIFTNFHPIFHSYPALSPKPPPSKRGRSFLRFFTRFFLSEGEKKSTPTPSRIGQPTVKMCDGGAYFSIGSLVFAPKKKLENPGSTTLRRNHRIFQTHKNRPPRKLSLLTATFFLAFSY